jgi:hypothetical protein
LPSTKSNKQIKFTPVAYNFEQNDHEEEQSVADSVPLSEMTIPGSEMDEQTRLEKRKRKEARRAKKLAIEKALEDKIKKYEKEEKEKKDREQKEREEKAKLEEE